MPAMGASGEVPHRPAQGCRSSAHILWGHFTSDKLFVLNLFACHKTYCLYWNKKKGRKSFYHIGMAPTWSSDIFIHSPVPSFTYLSIIYQSLEALCAACSQTLQWTDHLCSKDVTPLGTLSIHSVGFPLSWLLYHPPPGCLGRNIGTIFESFFFSRHNPALLNAWICIRAPTSTICQEILSNLKCHKYSLIFGFPCHVTCLDLLIDGPGGYSRLLIGLWTPVFLSPFCIMQPESVFFLKK